MPTKRKPGKAGKKKSIEKLLNTLAKAEGEVAPQERFSSVGTNYGVSVVGVGRAPVTARATRRGKKLAEAVTEPGPRVVARAAAPAEVAAVKPADVLAGLESPEPVIGETARKNIQGNIIPGFNKDYQHFLFYRMGKKAPAKKWLSWIAPMISSMDEVLAFNRMYRTLRFKLGTKDVPIKATWVNIGFSSRAISSLTSKETAAQFGDESFRQGLAARSEYLGDPTKTTQRGNKSRWKVGGPNNESDILVIVGSDDPSLLREMVKRIKISAVLYELTLIYQQSGETLPDPLRGHEHFGFKDGISQPGVRGRVSDGADDFLTPRYLQPTDDRSRLFAKPGQLLVWPGQFVLGMSRQNPEDLYSAVAEASNFPKWANYGSYLVCRRLRQDVRAFMEFVVTTAADLGIPAEKFAAMLVGRWPSGAPIMRTPGADIPDLGADDLASNHFLFDDDTRPSSLNPIPGYPGDTYTQAQKDMLGLVCPHFAHIRKVNPRDSATDLGKVADSLIRMIMRRGIPFGPPVVGVKEPPESLWKTQRGLMFVCYQSSIEDQFEFLTRRWANSTAQPNVGGHDPIIGQESSQGSLVRFIDFPKGGSFKRVQIKQEWVFPDGGGYFFSPPINAIADVLAR